MKARALSASLMFVSAFALADTGHDHAEGDPTRLGKVHFPISCSAESQRRFDVGHAR